jgi:hypothetical protein
MRNFESENVDEEKSLSLEICPSLLSKVNIKYVAKLISNSKQSTIEF